MGRRHVPVLVVEPEEVPPMAQKAAAGFVSRARALAWGLSRHVRKAPALATILLVGLIATSPARADPIRGEASFSAGGGGDQSASAGDLPKIDGKPTQKPN